ncbi:hypothetical protein HJA82_29320 [Rhizobium bangladeshense]|uniref:hypothetical protein n=1 Tax=Rhizobium TaxID=379 RepID=UPI001C83646C|nr:MULTISPECIES: hypothetical protein [Rhizobium]MBX4911416.1 hypothetical protein [Rhizobium bangladeshense]MBX5130710.1 hypothetical protein [Rhizobium lentis]
MMATIDLLIEVEDDGQDEGRAADLIGESLRPLLRTYADGPSDIIDWRYVRDAEDHNGEGFELAQPGEDVEAELIKEGAWCVLGKWCAEDQPDQWSNETPADFLKRLREWNRKHKS